MDQELEKAMFDNADKFIDLANELSKTIPQNQVGMALRYAAARFSAFEASTVAQNLADDKDKHLEFFLNTFSEMLQKNLDEYIWIIAKRKQEDKPS